MTPAPLRPLNRGLVLLAAGGLALTLGACSSDSSEAASKSTLPSATSASSSSAPPNASSSSPAPYPSTTSIGMSGSPLGQALTQEQQGELSQLVGLSSPMTGDTGRGGSSGSYILQVRGEHSHAELGQGKEAKGTVTITAACLGTPKAVPVVVTVTPNADAPKSTVVKTMTCPAGADQGHGMKVYEGKVSGVKVTTKNTGTVPVAFAVGFLDS